MNAKEVLLKRLGSADPGWPEWKQLIQLVASLDFEYVEDDFGMHHYFISGNRLCFMDENREEPIQWPDWMPGYVQLLYGMKANDFEFSGGYAEYFDGVESAEGSDDIPEGISITEEIYPFQSTEDGNLFHINKKLEILYPDSENNCFVKLDSLETFTRRNIEQTLQNRLWSEAYSDL